MATAKSLEREEILDRSLASVKEEAQIVSILRRFMRNKAAVVSLIALVLLYAAALLAPVLAKQPLDFLDVTQRNLAPGAAHIMGTDGLGRDVLDRLIWGSRVSLSVGLIAMGMSLGIGVTVGAVAGYYGGSGLDILLMRIAESVEAIPFFFLLITLVAVVRPSIWNTMIVIGLTSWPGMARIVRGEFLSLRQRDYTEASRAMGATDSRLIWRHIFPNAIAPIIVAATLGIGSAILTESSLSFLGFGTQPPMTSWGQMLATGRQFMRQAPWVAFFPGLPILVTVLAFNFVGDGLRDAMDPKMKR